MNVARYAVHKLIQDLMRDPAQAATFAKHRESVFESYGLTEREKELLRDGSRPALHELGVHPNLQMKYSRFHSPAAAGAPSRGGLLAAYLDRLQER